MVEGLVKRGHPAEVWNRTRAKAEPLAAQGAKVVDRLSDLADVDILFTMVATASDLEAVLFGKDGAIDGATLGAPRILVDWSRIGAAESAAIPARIDSAGAAF